MAWSKANPIEASVLPPPVGTVRENSPGSLIAPSRQSDKISALILLISVEGAF